MLEGAPIGPDQDIILSNSLAQEHLKKVAKGPPLDAKSAIQQDFFGVTRALPKSTVTSSSDITKVLKEEADKQKDFIEYSSHWLIWPIFGIAIIMMSYGWFKIFQFLKG